MAAMTRRAALAALGVGAAVGVGVGAGVAVDREGVASAAATSAATVASWVGQRGDRYYIGHRGSGDVYPEHSMEAYSAAVAGGAQCMELSVGMTADGFLVCMHDPTYDRTTTAKGQIAAQPSTVLRSIRLSAPQLGPAWALPPQPQVPLYEDVLRAFGGRLVLCIEAKNDAAYPAVMAAVEAHGLKDSVIAKIYYSSPRIAQAKAAGYPVFAYFGSATDVTAARIAALAKQLDARRDYMILPTGASDVFVKQAVATGIPIWIFPAHRRSEAARFFSLGCKGIISSSLRYVSHTAPTAMSDTWAYGAIAPGEMTKDPGSGAYAPTWSQNQIQLGLHGAQHFLTLGQFAPIAKASQSYTVQFQASWPVLPASLADNMTVAFGHADDAYYEHRSGLGSGYHAILRADGRLQLFRHQDGKPDGIPLGASIQTPAPTAGNWMTFQLKVTPSTLTWSRTDVPAATVSVNDGTIRGGYLHIGRSSVDGELAFRSLSLS